MKTTALALVLVFGQESTSNLHETIAWICNFTNDHGSLHENGALMQTIHMQSVRGCTVKLERRFLGAKGADSIKRETMNLELDAFDPKVHVQVSRTGSPSFQVTFERSDRADNIEIEMEMNNGTKVKSRQSNESIYMDSEESVNRLAKGLSHAIELCGGRPASF